MWGTCTQKASLQWCEKHVLKKVEYIKVEVHVFKKLQYSAVKYMYSRRFNTVK